MTMIALAAAGSVFMTVYLLLMAFSRPSENRIRQRAALLGMMTRPFAPKEKPPSFGDRILGPLLDVIGDKAFAILPQGMLARQRRKLLQAGDPITVEGYIIMSLIAAGVLAGLGFAVGISMMGSLSAKVLLAMVMMGGFGFLTPNLFLNSRISQRRTAILKSLPDSFDLITTCVEAGLGLDAALSRVAEKVGGPFAEELSVTLREIGMGRPRAEALHDLADRANISDLAMFVNAIIQAEQMGTSIGTVLRVQSEQMRTRRRQRAEELANQAPVKMTFPLVLCIFPTLFIVILGPAVIQLYETYQS